jgi:hypothetical protein
MSVLSRSVSGCRRFFSPACAVPRLRILYYTALAALAVTLLAAHRLVVREHQDARLVTVATHACQLTARLPVVFVRVPAAPAAPAAVHQE